MNKNNKEEMVILYDENNQKINGYFNRYNIPKNKGYYYSINIWLILKNKKIIIQKRSSTKRIYPNKFECVAGGVIENETVLQACVREVKEELGICLKENDLLKIDFFLDKKHNYFMHTFICLIDENIVEKIKINLDEISEIKIVDFREVVNMINDNQFADSIKIRFKNYEKILCEKINKIDEWK